MAVALSYKSVIKSNLKFPVLCYIFLLSERNLIRTAFGRRHLKEKQIKGESVGFNLFIYLLSIIVKCFIIYILLLRAKILLSTAREKCLSYLLFRFCSVHSKPEHRKAHRYNRPSSTKLLFGSIFLRR